MKGIFPNSKTSFSIPIPCSGNRNACKLNNLIVQKQKWSMSASFLLNLVDFSLFTSLWTIVKAVQFLSCLTLWCKESDSDSATFKVDKSLSATLASTYVCVAGIWGVYRKGNPLVPSLTPQNFLGLKQSVDMNFKWELLVILKWRKAILSILQMKKVKKHDFSC